MGFHYFFVTQIADRSQTSTCLLVNVYGGLHEVLTVLLAKTIYVIFLLGSSIKNKKILCNSSCSFISLGLKKNKLEVKFVIIKTGHFWLLFKSIVSIKKLT